jgi:hypothetical protein
MKKKLLLIVIFLFIQQVSFPAELEEEVLSSQESSDSELESEQNPELFHKIEINNDYDDLINSLSVTHIFEKLKDIYTIENVRDLVDQELKKFTQNKKVKINLDNLKANILSNFNSQQNILNFCQLLFSNIYQNRNNPKVRTFVDVICKVELNEHDIEYLYDFLRENIQANLNLQKNDIIEQSDKNCCCCIIL